MNSDDEDMLEVFEDKLDLLKKKCTEEKDKLK